MIPVLGWCAAVNTLECFYRHQETILNGLLENFCKLVSEVNNLLCAIPAAPCNAVALVWQSAVDAMTFRLKRQSDAHLSHRLCFIAYCIQQGQQGCTKLIVWLLGFSKRQFTNGCLAAPNCFGDLWLRHLAVTLDVGNNVFPVHGESITGLRYSQTANRYLFFVSCGHGN